MALYKVWACLEDEGTIEADSKEEAFINFSDQMMLGGSWQFIIKEVGVNDDEENEDEE